MPVDKHIEGYMSLPEAAKYAHVTRQAIYLAMRNRGLRGTKIGKQWYVTKTDLDEYRGNKYNRDLRKQDGEYVFDMDKGYFSVSQVCRVMSATLGKPYSMQHIYYLLRTGQMRSFRKGAAWVIPKDDAVALLDKEKKKLEFAEKLA